MKIADGFYNDPSCSDVFMHIVRTLSQLRDTDTVWKFVDWTLQRNQQVLFSNLTAEGTIGQINCFTVE